MIVGAQIEHGHPSGELLGDLTRWVMYQIIDQIEDKLSKTRNYYLDTTWIGPKHKAFESSIDNLFLFGLVDPSLDQKHHALAWYYDIKDISWPDIASTKDLDLLDVLIKNEIIGRYGINMDVFKEQDYTRAYAYQREIEIGYTDRPNSIMIDFCALLVSKHFKQYTDYDLAFRNDADVHFLCYQNKPSPHRQYLRHLLNKHSCRDRGVMTLSPSIGEPYQYPGLTPVPDPYMPNHPYAARSNYDNVSLGDLSRWQNSFLIVVSETCSNRVSCFVSEKTYKPIIGLRPFVINGGPKIYRWLEKAGFDTFEDLWPDVDLREFTDFESHCRKIMHIIDRVSAMTSEQMYQWYQFLLPRLQRNRQHFFDYAAAHERFVCEDVGARIMQLDL